MELTSLCMLLASLRISPGRLQFFKYESVSLSCEEEQQERNTSSTGWGVSRRISRKRGKKDDLNICATGWGGGPSCLIGTVYPSDSGSYWCECGERRSHAVNLTVTEGNVILESPVLPVAEETDVTLHCWYKDKTTGKTSSDLPADFYKDGSLIRTESTGQMIVHNVSASDEGHYKCNIPDLGESPDSWMGVRVLVAASTTLPPSAHPIMSKTRLVVHLLVFIPYLVSTALVVSIYIDRARGERNM